MQVSKITSFLLVGLMSFPAFSANKNVERIQVTGSRIKRINIEGPSPLLILDKADLENSGYNSVADILRDTNITPFGVSRESTGSSVAGESFISVHGAKTLILINGHRVIEDPNAESVDLHLIPIFAVERVEIIKDGSSAIYGSDAMGGVINFILKENFSGQEIHARVSPSYKGGSKAEGAITWGKNLSRGSLTGVIQARFNDSIISADRKWSTDRISPTSPFPVFVGGGQRILDPRCPAESRTPSGICEYNYSEHLHTLPSIAQLSNYIQAKYKLSGVDFYSQILTSYKRTQYEYPPLPGSVDLSTGHKMSVGTAVKGNVINRFMEIGPRKNQTDYLVADTTFGGKGYLSSNWDWDISFKLSGTLKLDSTSGLLVTSTLTDKIQQGIYDPFNPATRTKENLADALYTSTDKNNSVLLLTDIIFSGNVGPINMATGINAFYINYQETSDPKIAEGDILSYAGSNGSGSRTIFSSFGEMSYAPFDSLELQLAGRADHYSDFSWTFNPKGSFKYQPFNAFLLRGSLGTSFIAPSMHNLYGDESKGFPNLLDSVACFNSLKLDGDTKNLDDDLVKDFIADQKETANKKGLDEATKENLKSLSEKLSSKEFCKTRQYFVKSGGNENLKETKGISASVGSVIQASDDVSLTLDGWYIKASGLHANGATDDAIKVELKKGSEFLKKHGVVVNRDSSNKYNPILNSETDGLSGIETKLLNIGSYSIGGVDLSLSAFFSNYNFKSGNFYLKEDGTLIFHSQSEGFPERGFKDNIGKAGLPRWKNISTLGWRNKTHDVAIKLNSFASVLKYGNELESLPVYHRVDLSYQWAMNSKTLFNMGWVNLLLSTPPMDNTIKTGSQIDEDIYEVRGPYFYVGFKKLM